MRRGCRRRHRERGSAVLEMPLVIGLLLIPFGMLIVSAPVWVERQTAARDAAAEVARYLVVSGGARTPEEIVAEIEAAYDLPAGTLDVAVPSAGFGPGETIEVTVTVEIPALSLPIFGGVGAVAWTAEHGERMPDHGADR